MGVDVSTYRARIGLFVSCRGLKYNHDTGGLARAYCTHVLLPRPSSLLLSLCFALLLLRAGDVEANPGPKIDDVLTLLRDCHAETTASLSEIKREISSITERISAVERSIENVSKFDSNIDAVADSVQEVKVNIERSNTGLKDAVEDMNNRMRRNNLIIKGLPEEEHEGYAESERIVKAFFRNHLDIEAGDIERAHRVGQRREGAKRPIIVKFLNFKSKMDALSNASKLKDLETPKVWLEEDFSPTVQLARKRLRDYAKEKRKPNERFSVRFNKLHMRSGIYRYDPASGKVIPITAEKRQTE